MKLVHTWPNGGIGNSSADQVPTELHYTNPLTRANSWGYEVHKTTGGGVTAAEPLKWFKLLLQSQSATSPSISMSSATGAPTLAGSSNLRTLESNFLTLGLAGTSTATSSTTFSPPTFTPAQKTAQKLQQLGISPQNVVADFLTSVREVTLASIQRTYDNDWVRESRIE